MSDVLQRVQVAIAEALSIEAEEVTLDASFKDDLGADSLEIVELVMALEDEFDLEITDEEADKMRNVRDVVRYIESFQ